MKLKKCLSLMLCLCLLTLSLCACGGSSAIVKTRIAVIVKSVDSDFWHNVQSGVNSAATEYNVSVTFEGPGNEEDYISQNEMIAAAAADGVDAIVLSAINYHESAAAVNDAARQGVKIVTIDSNVNSQNVAMFIGTDNIDAGRAAGAAAADSFSNGEKLYIGLVNYYQDTENGQRREQGFREYIGTLPNAELVEAVNVDSNTQSATAGAVSLLKKYPQINVLVGFNEWTTLGVGNAIKQLSLSHSVHGIGFDTNVVSIGMIETGEMDALIVQNPFAIGYLGVKNAAALVTGEAADTEVLYTATTTVKRENLFNEDIQKILFRFQ